MDVCDRLQRFYGLHIPHGLYPAWKEDTKATLAATSVDSKNSRLSSKLLVLAATLTQGGLPYSPPPFRYSHGGAADGSDQSPTPDARASASAWTHIEQSGIAQYLV